MRWKKNRAIDDMGRKIVRFGWLLRWIVRLFLMFLIVDLFYLAVTWPDWRRVATGPVPKSNFISDYQTLRKTRHDLPVLHWQSVSLSQMPKTLLRAVVLAEDSRFYEHSGFDLIAFKEAMDYNLSEGRFILGASTISQQTVKNLFLSRSRNPLRKWHELVLTWGMEQNLGKRRILEIYLNIVEMGQGIYGVESAARAYWGTSVQNLTSRQAAELAATLPSPVKNNPATRTQLFEKRAKRIHDLLIRYPGNAAQRNAADVAPVEPAVNGLPPVEERSFLRELRE